jgi:hypothetical protein
MIDFNIISFGEMLPYERYKLYTWVVDINPKSILEVGCGEGGATYCMAEAIMKLNSEAMIHACDPRQMLDGKFFKTYPFVNYYQMESHEFIQHIIKEKISVDFILFDGPEELDVALEDIMVLEQYIKAGTFFCMHDWELLRRGYDGGMSTKAQKIRPYIEQSERWVKKEVLSGVHKNSTINDECFDSVGLCLYEFIK